MEYWFCGGTQSEISLQTVASATMARAPAPPRPRGLRRTGRERVRYGGHAPADRAPKTRGRPAVTAERPGGGQTWEATRYATNARYVADLAGTVLAWLAPRPGERVLDLGCGDGALTEAIAAAGASVVGIDAAPDMVRAARERGLDARVADGLALPFDCAGFDAVFSNAALHWMSRHPAAVAAGVHRALRPGGRFVGEFGGHGNVAAITVALVAVLRRRGIDGAALIPWYFPTPEAYRAVLEGAGFAVERIELVSRPTPLPTDMAGWLDTFAEPFLAPLPPAERAAARDEVLALLAPALRDDRGRWTADYVRLRFLARRGA
jgi:SAM-dependent methyltransferase